MKKIIIPLFCLLFWGNSQAAPYERSNYGSQSRQTISEPAMVLKQGLDALTGHLVNRGSDRIRLLSFLEQKITPYFDFQQMSRWAAGPQWRSLNPKQRLKLAYELKQEFFKILVGRLTRSPNLTIEYLEPQRQQRGNKVSLGVKIYNQRSQPVRVDFRLHKTRNGWKIYDVVANSSSLVDYFRQYVRNNMDQRNRR